ncbi:hypothetical protein HERIO_1745 [Hepatospora eriocheir]|uniref:Uncharacterized protein n=1 Tax=Hepatospora eriocheir TaxID=1081669 RepID=A0A1X0Q9E7_9MICR|nr:hypothetical protein HERIO_1745 [Hepatospora eriocheir]
MKKLQTKNTKKNNLKKSKTIVKRKVTTAPKTTKSKSDKNIISKPPEDFYTKLYRAFNDSTSNNEDDNDYLDFIRIK